MAVAANRIRNTGDTFLPWGQGAVAAAGPALLDGQIRIRPWFADSTFTLTGLYLDVQTAQPATTAEAVIYSESGSGSPDRLYGVSGPFDTSTVGVKTDSSLSVTIAVGRMYWIGMVARGAGTMPTLRHGTSYPPLEFSVGFPPALLTPGFQVSMVWEATTPLGAGEPVPDDFPPAARLASSAMPRVWMLAG